MNLNIKIDPSKFSFLLPITLGILLVYSNYVYLSDTAGSYESEDYYFAVKLLPSLVYLIIMPFAIALYFKYSIAFNDWKVWKKLLLGSALFLVSPIINNIMSLIYLKYFFKTWLFNFYFFSEISYLISFCIAASLFAVPIGHIFFRKKRKGRKSDLESS